MDEKKKKEPTVTASAMKNEEWYDIKKMYITFKSGERVPYSLNLYLRKREFLVMQQTLLARFKDRTKTGTLDDFEFEYNIILVPRNSGKRKSNRKKAR